jgi:DNA-binding NtrC family response regulator
MDDAQRTVLVVDDEPHVRGVLVDYLTSRRFKVIEAGNGLEALAALKNYRPSAIVLDLRMPRLGGIDALKRIRAFDPAATVVVVTGAPDVNLHRQAIALGARALLPKPIALDQLLAVLNGSRPSATEAVAPLPKGRDAVAMTSNAEIEILIVDDDEDSRDMLETFVRSLGYRSAVAVDAAAAIRTIVQRPPAVILLDIHMPGLNGVDALPTIRGLVPHVAVIMVSGVPDAEVSRRALAYGAFDYVMKPVDLDYLTRALETAVAMRAFDL